MDSRPNLGALDKSLDVRDVSYAKLRERIVDDGDLGGTSDGAEIDFATKMKVHMQKSTPTCGAHAGGHAKQILDFNDTGENEYAPFYLWKKIKSFDGYSPDVGTDLRSILKGLKQYGICDLSLLPYQGNKKIAEYSKDDTTPEQNTNAKPRIIGSYAFCGSDKKQIMQAITDGFPVILLLRFGREWWGSKTVSTNGSGEYGHFVVAYGHDGENLKVVDSADSKAKFKTLTSTFNVRDSAAVTDVPDAYIRDLIESISWLQKLIAIMQKLKITNLSQLFK